jgi:hypothetical protein
MGKKMTKAKIAEFKALNQEVEEIINEGAKLSKMLNATIVENAKGRYSDIIALGALAKTVALAVCAQQEVGIPMPMEKFLTLLETELKIAKNEIC